MSFNKLYHEIFREFEEAPTRKDKIAVLQKYGDKRLMDFILFAMHPAVKFDISKLPEYKPSIIPEGLNYTNLAFEIDRLYVFIPEHPKYRTKLPVKKEQEILHTMLESMHADEAKLLMGCFKKNLPVKGLTPKIVKEAFPNLPF
jgi:hypothetical protein